MRSFLPPPSKCPHRSCGHFSIEDLSINSHLFYLLFVLLFYTLGYNLIVIYLFYCSSSFTFGDSELFHLVPVSLWHDSIILCMCYFFSTSSLSDTTSAQAHFIIYLIYFLSQTVTPRNTGPFDWRIILKTIYGHNCHCY